MPAAPNVACGAQKALRGVDLYIGDGATIKRTMVRKRGQMSIGHASIVAQLGWCKSTIIRQAIFTHCGSKSCGAVPVSLTL